MDAERRRAVNHQTAICVVGRLFPDDLPILSGYRKYLEGPSLYRQNSNPYLFWNLTCGTTHSVNGPLKDVFLKNVELDQSKATLFTGTDTSQFRHLEIHQG